jgi:sterol 3beta-glucosyltransferase
VVGYWYTEERENWQPPPELSAFLDAGEPPVLVSLGAMSLGEADPKEVAGLFVDAVQRAGVRAVIQGWEAGIKQLTLPETIFAAGSLPHSWLLPRCAAVVHHGGYGTTAAGLRAGVPALVIPHIADQFFWGDIVHKLGVGPRPLRRAKLSLETLTTSIQELIHTTSFSHAAVSLGDQIRTESGVDNAIRQIEEVYIEGIY